MRKIVVFILFFFSSCGDEDNTKLKNKLFEEPILFSSHNQIITLYSNNPYDIIINYNTPCGYNKLKFEFDLGNVLLITNPSKNSKSGKVKIRLSSQKSGKGIFKIILTDNCEQSTDIYFQISVQESLGYEGLLANYDFNNNAKDKSGNGNNAEVYGATLTKDRKGNDNSAYRFDGVDDYIIITKEFFNIGSENYTISGWFYIEEIKKQNQNIFNIVPSYGLSLDWNKTDNPFVVSFSLNNNPEIKSWNIASSIGVLGSVGEKKWHHFLLLKNKNTWSLYVDGVGNSFYFNSNPIDKYFGIIIGKDLSSELNANYFKGKLDDLYFFDRLLNQKEIKYLMEN